MLQVGNSVISMFSGIPGEVIFVGPGSYEGIKIEANQVLVKNEGYKKPFLYRACNLIKL